MATLAELIKGFRANVREGIPTKLDYTGDAIYLISPSTQNGYVGICIKPSKSKQVREDMPDILTYANTGIPRPEY